jgi:hypothetical protein
MEIEPFIKRKAIKLKALAEYVKIFHMLEELQSSSYSVNTHALYKISYDYGSGRSKVQFLPSLLC